MKVKIIKCSDRMYWYKDLVGLEFEVERNHEDCYWVRELDTHRCLNLVLKKDAEVVVDKQH